MTADVTPLTPRRPVPVRGAVQGTLALDLEQLLDPPTPPEVDLPAGAAGPGCDVVPVDLRARRDLERWARRFCQAAVEIAGGDRPPVQLSRWTSAAVLGDLSRRAQLVGQASVRGGLGRSRETIRPQVRSVHAGFLSATCAEVSAHVRYGRRSRAVAARFERRADRWVCTALEFA